MRDRGGFPKSNPAIPPAGRRCIVFSQVSSFDPRMIFCKKRYGRSYGSGYPPCVHKQVKETLIKSKRAEMCAEIYSGLPQKECSHNERA